MYSWIPMLTVVVAAVFAVCTASSEVVAQNKDIGEPRPILARYWDQPFMPGGSTLIGSYTSIIRHSPGDFVAFNNSIDGSLDGGLVMWTGKDNHTFDEVGVVFRHELIDDVFGPDGELYAKRRLTRPFIDWHPDAGYVGIVHVCADYGPIDGRVYPAMVTSQTGKAGTWTYHGKLKGEIWDEFGDESGKPRWADGGGFYYQHDKPATLDRAQPLNNRYLFFSNQYAGEGSIALLYSNDGKQWYFHRNDAGKIVNLIPMFAGRIMIFPHIIRLGDQGWAMFLSEKWPPIAIYRLASRDGLNWEPFGEQPEIVKPDDLMIKNVNGWYDDETGLLHGYLSVWAKQADGEFNYSKFHSTTRDYVEKPKD